MNEKAGIGVVASSKRCMQFAVGGVVAVERYLVLGAAQKGTRGWAEFVTALGVPEWSTGVDGTGRVQRSTSTAAWNSG